MYSLYFITFQRSGTRPVTKPLRSIRPEQHGTFHTPFWFTAIYICIYIYVHICVQHYSTQKMTTLIQLAMFVFLVRSPWNQSCWARFFTSTRGVRTTAPCCWVMDSVYPRIPMTEGQGCWWTRWMTVYMCIIYIYRYNIIYVHNVVSPERRVMWVITIVWWFCFSCFLAVAIYLHIYCYMYNLCMHVFVYV